MKRSEIEEISISDMNNIGNSLVEKINCQKEKK